MKKIMFNDKYGLTQAVLDGRKTMTRRLINLCENDLHFMKISDRGEYLFCSKTALDGAFPRYKVGEILAIAQSYKNIVGDAVWLRSLETGVSIHRDVAEKCAGWGNKIFVEAGLMPHRIRITDIKIERLQECSDDDMLKEGILQSIDGMDLYTFDGWVKHCKGHNLPIQIYTKNIREAFAALIDKVSGKGTWDSNPWVFAYTFELMKGGEE